MNMPAKEGALPSDARPVVLCVDDEPHILEGLALHLRRRYEVLLATSGAAGLELLRKRPQIAVVMSDMRMPQMDGAAFLRQARELAPDSTRLLLTGHADLESAAAAINEGRIFRFLTKPCPPPVLLPAMEAALEQHRLVTAERELLERTVHGSIRMLTDLMTVAHPLAFGRASRIKQLVTALLEQLQLRDRWQVEVAAMLSQLPALSLPTEIVEKLYYVQALNPEEQKLAEKAAAHSAQLLGNIPRIEVVREMLARFLGTAASARLSVDQQVLVDTGAALLRVAADFDALEAQGNDAAVALDVMRSRAARYRAEVLAALAQLRGGGQGGREMRELPLKAVRVGMVFAEDFKLNNGVLLVPRGYEVTASVVERIAQLRPGASKEPIRMFLSPAPAAAKAA